MRAKINVVGVTDTIFPDRLCNRKGRYRRFLSAGVYDVKVEYADRTQMFRNVEIISGRNSYIYANFPGACIISECEHNRTFMLNQSSTTIRYSMPTESFIEIFDISGKLVFGKSINKLSWIDIADFSNGIYLVRIYNSDSSIVKKIAVVK